jgi:Ca2+-binding EF-hand superfamily protein
MGCAHSNEKTKDQIVVNTSQQKLSEEQIEQLLKTRFSRSEILDWHRIFIEKCGASGDTSSLFLIACVNKQLFIDYFNQLHPNGDVTRLTETFFRTYDLNNDGTIDFMEFMNAVSIIRRGDLTEKLSFIFSLLDSNQEGYIDRLKLVQIMEALYNIKGINYTNSYNILLRKVDSIITRLDKDKEEGRILRNKFIESCMNDPALRDLLNVYK